VVDVRSPSELPAAKGKVTVQEPTRAERSIARRAAESRATVPDLELHAEIDMSAGVRRQTADRISTTGVLLKACALALRAEPRANAAYRDERFELYSRVNVGVAVETGGAYAIATLFDADGKSLTEITAELDAIRERGRSGALTPPELSGATATLYNLGALGIASSTAVINPPHAVALAAGAIREVPVVRDGDVVPGLTMMLTLICDHRILYGPRAAGFLARIKALLERPGELEHRDR
jgi:pyruvate dehydrogenase E2 component (dihydrolipoamide acetyltransferase)